MRTATIARRSLHSRRGLDLTASALVATAAALCFMLGVIRILPTNTDSILVMMLMAN